VSEFKMLPSVRGLGEFRPQYHHPSWYQLLG
jgi:hypothetical protein